jgi:hypothetical protein
MHRQGQVVAPPRCPDSGPTWARIFSPRFPPSGWWLRIIYRQHRKKGRNIDAAVPFESAEAAVDPALLNGGSHIACTSGAEVANGASGHAGITTRRVCLRCLYGVPFCPPRPSTTPRTRRQIFGRSAASSVVGPWGVRVATDAPDFIGAGVFDMNVRSDATLHDLGRGWYTPRGSTGASRPSKAKRPWPRTSRFPARTPPAPPQGVRLREGGHPAARGVPPLGPLLLRLRERSRSRSRPSTRLAAGVAARARGGGVGLLGWVSPARTSASPAPGRRCRST